jgi:glycosyltransferase involved in cell wall biosynthesis
MPKKISFLIESLDGGGSEKVFKNLTNYISSNTNIIIELVLVKKKGVFLKDLNKNIKIIDLKSNRTLFAFFPLIKYLKKTNSDAIISTLLHMNILLTIANLFVRNKKKIIIRESSTPSVLINEVYHSLVFKKIFKFFLFFFYKKQKNIICPSQGVAEDLQNTFKVKKNNIKVIYNPINFHDIDINKNKIISENFFKSSSKMIISIGRLDRYKNHIDLLEVFNQIYKKFDIKLSLFGNGPEKNNLDEFIKKNNLSNYVRIFNFNDNPYKYLNKSHIFVSTSIFEGFPNSLLEAVCMGKICISYDCESGPKEIFENNKYGHLINLFDKDALKKTLLKLIANNNFYKDSFELKLKYGIKAISNKYIDFILKE